MQNGNDFSRLEINLTNCLENYKYFRGKLQSSTKLLVLVKANAYGHGAVQFAKLMEDAGADYLAVAYPVEGIELKEAGVRDPILVLTPGQDDFEDIVSYGLEPSIPNLSALAELCKVLNDKGIKDYPVHIKLDTGMHRLGFMSDEVPALLDYLNDCPYIKVKSIFSHLSVSEEPESDDYTHAQVKMFQENAAKITEKLGYKPMYHILNSAGIERFPQYQFDMVRLGIGIYGVSAVPGVKLAPVASLKCKILQIKHLHQGDGDIGYGRYGKIAPEGTVVATIPVGYADGINRHLGRGNATFSLNGHRVPTIGNICMDMCMLDITGVDAKIGDTVTIFGEDPTVNELADILDTIPYEILTPINRRIARIVVK